VTDLEKLIKHLEDSRENTEKYCKMFLLDYDNQEDHNAFRYCLYGRERPELFLEWKKYKFDNNGPKAEV